MPKGIGRMAYLKNAKTSANFPREISTVVGHCFDHSLKQLLTCLPGDSHG
jgi:hypothetical protein